MSSNPAEVDWDWVYKRNKRIWLGLDENDNPVDEKELEPIKSPYGEASSSQFGDLPFLPKTLGVPKTCIVEWYAKRYKGENIKTNNCFFTWSDNGKPSLMFTAIFKCPITGELFGCGQFGEDETSYKVTEEAVNEGDEGEDSEKVKIVWHRKKKNAEHAVAARALDCLSYREGEGSKSYGLCKEAPYLEEDEYKFRVPSSVPSNFYDWLDNEIPQKEAKPIEMEVDEEGDEEGDEET